MLDKSAYTSPKPPSGKSEMAEHALRSALVHGTLAPGARLSEARLAADFRLGRGAVRAALSRMQAGGFVWSSARSGWLVAPVSAAEIREVCAARRQLEPLVATVVPDEASAVRLAGLAEIHRTLARRDDLGRELIRTIRRADREILDILAAGLEMPMVARWLIDLWDRSARLVNFFEGRRPVAFPPPDRSALVAAILARHQAVARDEFAVAGAALEAWLFECFLDSGATLGQPGARHGTATRRGGHKPAANLTATQGVGSDETLS